MPKTILIVDDEQDILEFLKYNIEAEGYSVLLARNGNEALRQAEQSPSLVLLDVMMPGLDGWETAKKLKKNPSSQHIPIIFLTARNSESDEVAGLNIGAEDYMTKPISIPKLLARINKVISRAPATQPTQTISIGDIVIDLGNYSIEIDHQQVQLPKKEFEVLAYLAQHPNKVISRDELLKNIWGEDVFVVDRTVDVRIRKVREKLGQHADYIETIKGVGYRFNNK
ncbi:MAG TPA: response regulator transcription factor [Candidatus Kapabacteria bacterium]|nr:response regulator transcription factor [Candidatus Kapabacteria bacterium]